MPISEHASFVRPPISVPLWRYTDLPKFIELLTSGALWLTNAEVLAQDDPFEGLTGPLQFPHRMWASIDDVPEPIRTQIVTSGIGKTAGTPEKAFRAWFSLQEQTCHMTKAGRRDFYLTCWHVAGHESVAMWKVYGAPGAGIAIVSNGLRLQKAMSAVTEDLYLGAVQYVEPNSQLVGVGNAFEPILIKRNSYDYEREVRLVYWNKHELTDSLGAANWNEERMRFDDPVDDPRPLRPGMHFQCNLDALIERVIVSPFAPTWYAAMIERLRDRLGYTFPVQGSKLLTPPPVVP